MDKALIERAMKLDIDTLGNSILWRPDEIDRRIDEGNILNIQSKIIY
jgi:hypothetical protein